MIPFHSTLNIEHSTFLRTRGCSSIGRAPALQAGGRRFDPDQLHQARPYSRDEPPVEPNGRAGMVSILNGLSSIHAAEVTARISGERNRKMELSVDLRDRKFLDN